MSGEAYSRCSQPNTTSVSGSSRAQRMNDPPHAMSPSDQVQVLASLRLVGALGLTVVALITGCFLGGLWVSRRYGLGMFPVAAGVVVGVVLSFVWTYQRLVHHLARPGRGSERRQRTGDAAEPAGRAWPSS